MGVWLVLLLASAEPQIDPRIAVAIAVSLIDPDAAPDAVLVAVAPKRLSDAEKDAAYLKENHWRLGPGSCGMLGCTVHPGRWILEQTPVPARPERRPQDAASTLTEDREGSGAGCPDGRCATPRFRLFRR